MLFPRATIPLKPYAIPTFSFQLPPVRFSIANLRPKKMRSKKAMKGTFKSKSGGSLRGTSVTSGDYGLMAMDSARITDKHIDIARSAAKKAIKSEKNSMFYLKCFPDIPVTSKPAETRMGKGKGAVDFFATWISAGRIMFEVGG